MSQSLTRMTDLSRREQSSLTRRSLSERRLNKYCGGENALNQLHNMRALEENIRLVVSDADSVATSYRCSTNHR